MRTPALTLIGLFLLTPLAFAAAQDTPGRQDGTTIHAEGSAQTKVQNDFLTIDLTLEKEGVDPAQLHDAIQRETDNALGKAKKIHAITVKTSGFSIYPVYEQDRIVRQRAIYQLSLETKEFADGLALAGAMQPFTVRNLSFSVSPERRKTTEKTLLEQAIADLRENIGIAAASLGAADITLTTLTIGNRQHQPIQSFMISEAKTMEAAAAPVSAEAGESQIAITVSGSAVVK